MNRDVIKILLQNKLIPEIYKTETSYLTFNDVYNLNLCSKNIRFTIENFCESKCQNFEDFETSKIIKFKKYKTWFTTLLFWTCKFPKIILKHLISENNGNVFISVIPTCEKHILNTMNTFGMTLFPRIKMSHGRARYRENKFEVSKKFDKILRKIEMKYATNYTALKSYLASKGFFSVNEKGIGLLLKEQFKINEYTMLKLCDLQTVTKSFSKPVQK